MQDITFCAFMGCPLKTCDRHLSRLQDEGGSISMADFAPTCRDYIHLLVQEVKSGERTGSNQCFK